MSSVSTTIEQLELDVQSNSTSAVGGIDALASSLDKLKNATKGGAGLTAVTKRLATLNTTLSGFSGAADNLNNLARGLQMLSSCGNLKLSSSVATQITNIGSAVRSLDGTDFSALTNLVNALAPLSNIRKANLNSFISQLQRLPQAVEALNSVNMGQLASQINLLVSALSPLSKMGKNNLTSFLTQLQKMPQVMSALRSVNMSQLASQIQQLANALAPLSTQMQSIANGFSAFPGRIQRLIQSNSKLSASNIGLGKSYANLAAKISMAFVGLKSITSVIAGWITESNSYIETMNLFTVSMGQYADEAYLYAQRVSEIMGVDPAEWMRDQGVFMTLADGFGVASDRAYVMSQNLTQLTYDLASFFNISTEDAFQKLESGIAGELEPLRRLGYDLSVARLQQEAYNLGIEKSVNAMSQAEKAELRYYAIMTQVTNAQGDMARTLEAPANQLRILQAQVTQCARAFGNLFIPVLNAVLPYVIAVVKVIRILTDIISGLFGFSLPEVDYSNITASTANIAGNASDIANGLDNAGEKAKELKKSLLGIDELNILSKPDYSSSGNANGSNDNILGGGLGFELPTYDFIGDATSSRVDEIVQKMKEWLGITGEIDSWSDLFNTNLGKILIVVGLIGAGFALWKLSKPFVSAFDAIGSLFGGKKSGKSSNGFSVPSPKTVLKGLADMALIIGGAAAVVTAIGLLMQIPGFEQTVKSGITAIGIVFNGLGSIVLPLTAVSAGVVQLGKIGVASVAKGFADLAIIIGGTSVLITAIGALISLPYFSDFISTGVASVVSVFNGLWQVALPIGTLSVLLVKLGIASPATILSGLAGFALVIAGLELVLVALGALQQIPGFSWIVGEGGKVLVQLGGILGEFAGSIVNSFLTKISESFPEIGKNLASFMTEAQPFFDGLGSINAEAVNAAKSLAEMILILTAADVLNGLTSWFTGGSSFADFGKGLCDFAPYFKKYAKEIEGIDGNAIQNSSVAAKSLAEFAQNIPNSGGVAGFFAGENDIDVWGEKLPSFGRNLKEYSLAVAGIDGSAIQNSATAAQALSELANNLPNSGGVAGFFAGENDIDVWGEKLPSFGKNLKEYSLAVAGIESDVVTASSAAAMSIVEFARNIPDEGGVVSWFAGDNSISAFGENIAKFGKNFVVYYNYIKNVKSDVVTASSAAAMSIVEFARNIPDEGGVVSWFAGDNSISAFGEGIAEFGSHFKIYYNYISAISTDKISRVSSEMNDILSWAAKVSSTDRKAIEQFGTVLNKLGEDFASCAKNIVAGFAEKMSSAYTTSKSYVVSWGHNVKKWFTLDSYGGVNKSTFETYGQNIITGFNDMISSKYTTSKSPITIWGSNLHSWFESAVDFNTFKNHAKNLIDTFNTGIAQNYTSSKSYINKWSQDLKNAFNTGSAYNSGYSYGQSFVNGITKAIRNASFPAIDGKVNISGTSVNLKLKAYATGGFPDQGQMFMARERGPELVGTIGNRSAVVNNDQIIDGIAEGVASANAEQNALLREAVNILRSLLEKDTTVTAYVETGNVISGLERKNKRDGRTIVPVGV